MITTCLFCSLFLRLQSTTHVFVPSYSPQVCTKNFQFVRQFFSPYLSLCPLLLFYVCFFLSATENRRFISVDFFLTFMILSRRLLALRVSWLSINIAIFVGYCVKNDLPTTNGFMTWLAHRDKAFLVRCHLNSLPCEQLYMQIFVL